MKKGKYGISIDMDWAPNEVIDYTLKLLSDYGVSATLFMTNKTNCDLKGQEIAIHPNFTSLDYEKHIIERLNDFPEAKGTRSHSLFFSEHLRLIYTKYKLEYQSNAMMYLQPNIHPYLMSPTTIELPFFLMDTFHIIMSHPKPKFDTSVLNLASPGLKIFDFHPVHIFLNTECLSRYTNAKSEYHNSKELIKHRNTKTPGTKDLFVEILKFCKENNEECKNLLAISNDYK